jgi:hypothetical protein
MSQKKRWYEIIEEHISSFPTFEEVLTAFKATQFTNPPTVRIVLDDESGSVPLDVVIASVHVKFARSQFRGSPPLVPYNIPDIEFRGWLVPTGYFPQGEIVRVRGRIIRQGTTPEETSNTLFLSR